MWKKAEIERNKVKEPVTASDGTKYECTVYDVTIPAVEEGAKGGIAGDEQEYLIYVDEFSDIRLIRVITPIKADGLDLCPVIVLAGKEVPLDEIRVTEGNLKLQLTRDEEEYEVTAENEEYSLEGRFEPEYDTQTGKLKVIYDSLVLKIDDYEFLRSSGDVTITAGSANIVKLDTDNDQSVMDNLFGGDDDLFGIDSDLIDLGLDLLFG